MPVLLCAGAMLAQATAVLAQTAPSTQPTLSATLGFDGVFKPDNWSPVYVTLADPERRVGTLELRAAHGRVGHEVVARVAANPRATTFTLYAPLGSLDRVVLDFRDADGRVIASRDLSDAAMETPAAFGGFAVAVSGETAAAQRVAGALVRDTGEFASAGVVATRLLPERGVGYRAVDALVIAGLDTDALDDGVESAIVEWVRAGGVVVAWPGVQRSSLASPLRALLPAEEGELGSVAVGGRRFTARSLTRRDGPGVADLSTAGETTFRRRVGLGQIVYTNVDPTQVPDVDATARLARWRRLLENEFSLLPDDRRAGVFDPLVAQSLAEQSVRAALPPGSTDWRPWLWVALGLGLLMGPGELVMLALARQHPRTPYTLAGLGVALASGVALCVVDAPREAGSRATLDVAALDGPAARVSVALGGASDGSAVWIGGDASDPSRQPAGAMRLAMREARIEPTPLWLDAGPRRPVVRAIESVATDRATTGPATRAGDEVIVTAAEVLRPGGQTTAADDPATRRVETGIERLAADPAWAAIFMDRSIAARLVRIQETEGATIVARREGAGADVRFSLRVER